MAGTHDPITSGHAPRERQLTYAPHGHILTNINIWSPNSRRIVYDARSDADGSRFDGTRIECIDVETGGVQVLYESKRGACCGVATWHPFDDRLVFILGPEDPTPDWAYGPAHRQGVMVDANRPGVIELLDARDLTPPFTPGALRGGSHVHVFSPDGQLVSFTYEDHVLSRFTSPGTDHDINQRNVAVSLIGRPVDVPSTHKRNHRGTAFSVLVTRTSSRPRPGSDDYIRAYEEGWVGIDGYVRPDGSRQRHAVAFLADVLSADGKIAAEVFIADLPDDLTQVGEGPLAGSETRMPYPPAGATVRRLTRTEDRRHPGVQGVRHWLRSSPDGSAIAALMRDDAGIMQLWTVSPIGDAGPRQLTRNGFDVASAFTWSPDGRWIAHVMDGSVCITETTGVTRRLTSPPDDAADAPLPLACVFSPDGRRIAFQRRLAHASDGRRYNQICVLSPFER